MRDDDAAVGEPKLPDYGTPTGPDAALPLYGSSDSVIPVESAVADFDPKAERRKQGEQARAAAAARRARKSRAAREAKAAEAARANRAKREALLERKQEAYAAAERRRGERAARVHARPPAWVVKMNEERRKRLIGYAAERRLARIVFRRRARVVAIVIASTVVVGTITGVVLQSFRDDPSPTVSDGVDWTEYPGQYAGDELRTLGGPRQEEVVADNVELLEELRAAVQKELAVSWIEHGPATEVPLENIWGGPSMLSDWQSPRWYATEEISDTELKGRVIDSVSDVLLEHGFDKPRLVNDPKTSFWTTEALKQVYGSTSPETQVVWELRATRFDNSLTAFQLTITDFSKDETGEFAEDARRDEEFYDRPVSSLAMTLTSHALLATSDEAEFRERAAPFKDKKAPESPPNG
ncbi:hypothetical protein [Agreia bicolorata]|uniref:CU044_5270 family protein n=1 Tax=Agreia bicolorata TaxID=110935 RepID=A0ABR5CD83_9MICO|nr:hypothetical protein [Agreia bicolorata]KJC63597.1 hypothetical protein TZ00_13765 [Agreia bicolorata]